MPLRKVTIMRRDDGLFDVVRERDENGESIRGCRDLDEAVSFLEPWLRSGEDPPGYVECGAVPPLPATPACMRERGHEGAHQSCSEDNVLSTWSCPNEAISGAEFLRGMQRALPDGYPLEAAPDSGPVKPDWHEEKLRSLSLEDLEGILEDDGWFSQHEGREVLRRLKDRRESPIPIGIEASGGGGSSGSSESLERKPLETTTPARGPEEAGALHAELAALRKVAEAADRVEETIGTYPGHAGHEVMSALRVALDDWDRLAKAKDTEGGSPK